MKSLEMPARLIHAQGIADGFTPHEMIRLAEVLLTMAGDALDVASGDKPPQRIIATDGVADYEADLEEFGRIVAAHSGVPAGSVAVSADPVFCRNLTVAEAPSGHARVVLQYGARDRFEVLLSREQADNLAASLRYLREARGL
jgi:hypothetical protein